MLEARKAMLADGGGDGACAARRNRGGRQRRHVPAHPAGGLCRIQKTLSERGRAYQPAEWAKILESVIDNSVDFGVVSPPVDDKRLTAVNIHRDELVIIAPPRHPLAA